MQTINGILIASCIVVPTAVTPENPSGMKFGHQFGFTGKLVRPVGWNPIGYIILEVGPSLTLDQNTDTICLQKIANFANPDGKPSPAFPATMAITDVSFAGYADGNLAVSPIKFLVQMTQALTPEPPFVYALSDVPFAVSIFRTPNMGVAASY